MSARERESPPLDEIGVERERGALRADVAALPSERQAALVETLERAAEREEGDTMAKGKATETAALAIRFSTAMLDAIDKAGEQIAKQRPDMVVTRSDAIRVLVAEGLAARKIQIR